MKLVYAAIIATVMFGVVVAGTAVAATSTCDQNIYVKHLQMGGGDASRCILCHDSKKDAKPGPLQGKYANMAGPNHGCTDCHKADGTGKAVPLPLPWEANSCTDAGCHPSKK